MKDFFYAGPATAPVGIVGLQFYGSDALLRSLVVSSRTSRAVVSDKDWSSMPSIMPASAALPPSTC